MAKALQFYRVLCILLAGCCGALALLRYFSTDTEDQATAYRIQESYFKITVTDKQLLAEVKTIKDLGAVFHRYGMDLPSNYARVLVAPGTSLPDGTAIFLSAPRTSRYTIPVPPYLKFRAPKPGEAYSLGKAIQLTADVLDSQGKIIRTEIKANGQVIGQLPCVSGQISGSWKPTETGVYNLAITAYDEFGLEGETEVSNIIVVASVPVKVSITGFTDGQSIQAGQAMEIIPLIESASLKPEIRKIELRVDGTTEATSFNSPYTLTCPALNTGICYFELVAEDSKGNIYKSPSYKVYAK